VKTLDPQPGQQLIHRAINNVSEAIEAAAYTHLTIVVHANVTQLSQIYHGNLMFMLAMKNRP
jgi:hypothetical protein